jgi:hypothetical protein
MKWRRTAMGGWITEDGRWGIRGPIFGKAMFWVYWRSADALSASRYTPTGKYDDAVSFPTAAAAKEFVEKIEKAAEAAKIPLRVREDGGR